MSNRSHPPEEPQISVSLLPHQSLSEEALVWVFDFTWHSRYAAVFKWKGRREWRRPRSRRKRGEFEFSASVRHSYPVRCGKAWWIVVATGLLHERNCNLLFRSCNAAPTKNLTSQKEDFPSATAKAATLFADLSEATRKPGELLVRILGAGTVSGRLSLWLCNTAGSGIAKKKEIRILVRRLMSPWPVVR